MSAPGLEAGTGSLVKECRIFTPRERAAVWLAPQDGNPANPGLGGGFGSLPGRESRESGLGWWLREPVRTGIPQIRAWVVASGACQDGNPANPGLGGGFGSLPGRESRKSGLGWCLRSRVVVPVPRHRPLFPHLSAWVRLSRVVPKITEGDGRRRRSVFFCARTTASTGRSPPARLQRCRSRT